MVTGAHKPLEQQPECNNTGRMQLSHVICEEGDDNKHGSDNQVWSQCWSKKQQRVWRVEWGGADLQESGAVEASQA